MVDLGFYEYARITSMSGTLDGKGSWGQTDAAMAERKRGYCVPILRGDMGYCPARLRERILGIAAEELEAVEDSLGRELSLHVASASSSGIPLRRGVGVLAAEVFRVGSGQYRLVVNPPAIDGPERAAPRQGPAALRAKAVERAHLSWTALAVRGLFPPTNRGAASDGVPDWALRQWVSRPADAVTAAAALRSRFCRRDYVEWCVSGLLAGSSAELGEGGLRALLAHEMGHIWLESLLPDPGEAEARRMSLSRLLGSLPPPATLRGVGREHEAAAESWALLRLDPSLVREERPDIPAWAALAGTAAGGRIPGDRSREPGGPA